MERSVAHRKAELRAAALARRSLVPERARAAAADTVAASITPILDRATHKVVAGSMPFRGELDPWPALRAAHDRGSTIVLPVTGPDGLIFRRWSPTLALVTAPFGMQEPPASAEELAPDLILLPLAAFDRERNRLGYGRAYYDRTIAAMRDGGGNPVLVGLAFAVQEVAAIPVEGHDVRLDFIITEHEVIG